MKNVLVALAATATSAALLGGCSAARDVEVTGTVQAGAGVTLKGPLLVEIVDRIEEGETVKLVSIDTVVLDKPGKFSATVAVEGRAVLVRALSDADDDKACSAGEAWAEAEVSVGEDDKAAAPDLTLKQAPCPEPAPEE